MSPDGRYHLHMSDGRVESGWNIDAVDVPDAKVKARGIYNDKGGVRGVLWYLDDRNEPVDALTFGASS